MLNVISDERMQGHYGLEYALANDEPTIQTMVISLAKPNRIVKQDKKIHITPAWRKLLKRELDERMKIRRRKQRERQERYYK